MKNLVLVFLLCFATGCATIGSLQPGAGGSTFEVTGKSYEEIWKASVRGMSSNLTIVESDKTSGSIKSEARYSGPQKRDSVLRCAPDQKGGAN